MKFREYLGAKGVNLCFLGMGGLFVMAILLLAEADRWLVMMLGSFFILLVFSWLLTGYEMERRRIMALRRLMDELPRKYLLGEVLPKPSNEIEKRYFEIMKTVSRSAVSAAEQAEREKEEYYDYVESWIHEIKTPLTACSLILANKGDVRKLKKELKCADNLTESILYYARMRSAEKDTRIYKLQAADVIGEAVKSQMELLIASGISVESNGDFSVYTDGKALCFILKQLLINSAKYCPKCRVRILAADGRIMVEDNGIGIPSYDLKRVTERGFTGTNGRRLLNSTGMGLYLVKELCTRLGMELEILSEENVFTRILLTFPSLTKM